MSRLVMPLAYSDRRCSGLYTIHENYDTICNLQFAANSAFFEYLSLEERMIPSQLCLAWWRETNLWYTFSGARAMCFIDPRSPAAGIFPPDFRGIITEEILHALLVERPRVYNESAILLANGKLIESIQGGRYFEC